MSPRVRVSCAAAGPTPAALGRTTATLGLATFAVLAAMLAPALAAAQVPAVGASDTWTVGAGAALESYTFTEVEATGIETLSLLTAPFAAQAALHRRFSVSASGAFARGSLTRTDGSTTTVEGPTDAAVRATLSLGQDLLVLSAAALLPTGSSTHTAEEAQVAGAIASDLLPFRISNWGTGGGADVSLALAAPVSDMGLGVRIGYTYVGEFEPFDDPTSSGPAFRYDPGDQLYVRLAADRNVGRASKLAVSATWQTFGEDLSGGTNLFRTGDRFQLVGSLAVPLGRAGSGWTYGGVLHRASGAFLQEVPTAEPPSQDVFFVGAGARAVVGGVAVLPGVDARALRTADGVGQGWTVGAGGSLEVPVGERLTLVPTGRARFGTVIAREDVESGFTGFEAGLVIRRSGR